MQSETKWQNRARADTYEVMTCYCVSEVLALTGGLVMLLSVWGLSFGTCSWVKGLVGCRVLRDC